jgi:hypothetical protein
MPRDTAAARRTAIGLALAGAALCGGDRPSDADRYHRPAPACSGGPVAVPRQLSLHLESGAFPGSAAPDVELHVPAGFDASRRPGVLLYVPGWMGCAAAALASQDTPCREGGDPRPAASIAAQVDAARVNAVVIAVELRADMPTGEPGQLSTPGMLRRLLKDVFAEGRDAVGCSIDVEQIDRVVVVAHSGGYQAAAAAISAGDVPQIREVVLLDALYGAQEAFARWVRDAAAGFASSTPEASRLRWVDLYTCCAGTAEPSKALAHTLAPSLAAAGGEVTLDDGTGDLEAPTLDRSVVFKRVPRPHAELPRTYLRAVVEAAGFARLP